MLTTSTGTISTAMKRRLGAVKLRNCGWTCSDVHEVVPWLHGRLVSFSGDSVWLATVALGSFTHTSIWLVSPCPPCPLHRAHLPSHIRRLHLSNSPSRPQPSPDTHCHPTWYAASPPCQPSPSSPLSTGQPTNILYSYLHTNYVRPPY